MTSCGELARVWAAIRSGGDPVANDGMQKSTMMWKESKVGGEARRWSLGSRNKDGGEWCAVSSLSSGASIDGVIELEDATTTMDLELEVAGAADGVGLIELTGERG
uniref:Uncharacterized protein n=1 Tax=Oryza barthii TaxID=65489 RepID=A0A0D3GIZ2_9ORYZ